MTGTPGTYACSGSATVESVYSVFAYDLPV
jgi:hypothetical protein